MASIVHKIDLSSMTIEPSQEAHDEELKQHLKVQLVNKINEKR